MSSPPLAALARAARAGDATALRTVRTHVRAALHEHGGNRDRAARALGIGATTLEVWLRAKFAHPRALGLDDLARAYPAPPRGRPAADL